MIKSLIAFCAKRTRNVQLQVLLATFYGLLSLYGFSGTVPIMFKMRKLALAAKNRRTR